MIKQIAPALVVSLLLGGANETKALQISNKVEVDEWANSFDDLLAQLEDPEDLDDELEVQLDAVETAQSDEELEEDMDVQLDAEDQASNKEGLEAMNAILEKLNAIAGEELQTDEQIEEAEKQLLAELDEDEEDDEEDLQLDEYGPVEDWNKGICA